MNLDSWKAYQDSDRPTKVITSNSDICIDALYSEFNRSLETSVFPPSMKLANAHLFIKRVIVQKKITFGQLAY